MAHAQQPSASSTSPTVVNVNGSRLEKEFPIGVESGQQTTSRSSLPPFIGQTPHSGKMLIVCFDGTGNDFNADNSNIVQLVSMLKRDDKTKQMVYYQAGIGTYVSPSAPVFSHIASKTYKILDEMLALSLDTHIMGGYEFLMQNYVAGDRICIFGFSRGSCTARSLAGMLHKIGLLPKDNHQQIPFAWKMYKKTDDPRWKESNAFRKSFSIEVPIEFLGVWDTVDSVGFIPKRLPFTTSNNIVRTFRHAVSLDERRSKFKMDLWSTATEDEQKLSNQKPEHFQELQKQHEEDRKHSMQLFHKHSSKLSRLQAKTNGHDTNSNDDGKGSNGGPQHRTFNGELVVLEDLKREDQKMDYYESTYSDRYNGPTDVDEVWFAGCHGDIGGGYVPNGTRYGLPRIPLRWMVRECFKTKSGIIFKAETLREIGIDPNTLHPKVLPRPPALFDQVKSQVIQTPTSTSLFKSIGSLFQSSEAKKKAKEAEEEKKKEPFISEEEEELRDSLSPKFDQLKLVRFWWILEVLPVSMTYQKTSNKRVSYIGINMGRPRVIPQEKTIKFHRSVKLRMEAKCRRKGDKYEPRPDFSGFEPKWVD
ncbi:hypothetical protein F5887DRAFT_78389 [Amanita rubescens]|nr:hypothetical protein F5887DRAFT_78389 [Amanita rubescens]